MECGWKPKNISVESSGLKTVKNLLIILFSLFFICKSLYASKEILLSLKGEYLAYSYDFNQLYGENIKFQFASYSVSCQFIKIDIPSRTFYTYGGVTLEKEEEKLQGDEFLFDPQKNNGKLIFFESKSFLSWNIKIVKDFFEKKDYTVDIFFQKNLLQFLYSNLKKIFLKKKIIQLIFLNLKNTEQDVYFLQKNINNLLFL